MIRRSIARRLGGSRAAWERAPDEARDGTLIRLPEDDDEDGGDDGEALRTIQVFS